MTKAATNDEATTHRFAKDQLKAFVERVERLEEEKKALADDIREVYAEAKGNGFDVKVLRTIIKLRRQDIKEPFSEVFITAGGQHYYSRLWYALDDSPFARADQREGFKRRWEAAQRYNADGTHRSDG